MRLAALAFLAPLLAAQSGIHPNRSGNEAIHMKGAGFEAEGVTLKQLLQIAYKTPSTRIFGPAWISENEYDVPPLDKAALRKTLDEAFKLKTRLESRQLDVFVLTQIPGNESKLVNPGLPGRLHDGDAHLKGTSLSMASIAAQLSEAFHRPVIDETGLRGRYTIDLAWDPDSPPELTEALKKQLGLRVSGGRRALEVLVVEHAEPIH